MRIVIIGILVASFIVSPRPEWFLCGHIPYAVRASVYPLLHGNLFHLAVNCLSAWLVFAPSRRDNLRDLVSGLVISFLVYPLSLRPVLGVSNLLYAVLGMRTPALASPWWERPEVLVFLVVTTGMLFFPQLSATTHMAAFILGMAVSFIRRKLYDIGRDARKYTD